MIKLNHNLPAPVDHIAVNRRLSAVRYLSIPEPPFTLSYFRYTVNGMSETAPETRDYRTVIHKIVSSVESIPETVGQLIDSLHCKSIYKKKLRSSLKDNNWSLDKTITRLLKLNLKNYQPRTKDVIEKMILFDYLNKIKLSREKTLEMMPFVERLNHVHDFINRSFETYYGRYIDTDYFKLFIEKMKEEYKNHPLESLADALKSDDWILNEKVMRDSLAFGSKYVKQGLPQTGFTDYNYETGSFEITDDAVMKILWVFTADIPKNSRDVNRLRVFIDNYFNPSPWRRSVNKSLNAAYKIRSGSIIEFIPGKDKTLAVRHIAGSDCTAEMDELISDSDSMFYKITHMNKWIGYACIISSQLPDGEQAAIIDVINFQDERMSLSSEMFEVLLDNMAKDLKEQRFRYILIPEDKGMLTNRNCGDIYRKYGNSPRVTLYPESDLSLDDILRQHKGFHSLYAQELLIVRDIMADIQPGLF